MDNIEEKKVDEVEETESTEWTEVEVDADEAVSLEEFNALKAKYEKVERNFKRMKAKEHKSKTTETVDSNDLKKQLREEISFYAKNPEAEKFEEAIDEYRDKWLTLDEAYKLAAAKEDPSLLISSQQKAKAEVANKDLDWVANADAGWIDFSTITPSEAAKLSWEEQDKYWEYKKNGG